MAGLGTYFVLLMVVSGFLLWRGTLFATPWALWLLMLSFPLPYVANTAGWMTAEIGRQPWVVYGLIRVSEGYSKNVSAGNGLFTLLGFMGVYVLLSILFIVLVYRTISEGPGVPSVEQKTSLTSVQGFRSALARSCHGRRVQRSLRRIKPRLRMTGFGLRQEGQGLEAGS
jgi:cytochrome d ubiquinol oxidase subunit I